MLQPMVSSLTGAFPLLLTGTVGVSLLKKTHNCEYCSRSIDCTSDVENGVAIAEGFVKGVVTYMITDDFEVTPMSEISIITLINCVIMKKDVRLE
ncbi:hypothetical protein KSP39_PZI003775 [Platanthera zijinensis]|uniref:Uncharacterized protein n=1 Tax=Platanthera zijinensis TaxID=2320716 RepID=A0AAP0BVS1_9ASPA